jgi:hypothetical protein
MTQFPDENSISIEVVNIINRFIKKPDCLNYLLRDNFFDDILGHLSSNNTILLKSIFDFLINILEVSINFRAQFIQKLAKIYYLSKLMQIYFNHDFSFKIQILR